jgi:hypothetical protein
VGEVNCLPLPIITAVFYVSLLPTVACFLLVFSLVFFAGPFVLSSSTIVRSFPRSFIPPSLHSFFFFYIFVLLYIPVYYCSRTNVCLVDVVVLNS